MQRSIFSGGASLLPRISVTRPVTVTVCLVALLAVGLVSYSRIRIQAFATGLDSSFIYVGAYIPSATSPQERDQQVGRLMSEHFRTLKGLRKIEVKSGETNTSARLYFRGGLDMAEVYNRLMDRVDLLKRVLPEEYESVVRVYKHNPETDNVVLYAGVALPKGVENARYQLERLVQPRLERIPGVASISIRGTPETAVMIELDQEKLRTRGVNPYELVHTLQGDNFVMGGGTVREGGKKFYVRSLARFESVEEIGSAPIPTERGNVSLNEIATISPNVPTRFWFNTLDGSPSVAIGVYKDSGGNIVKLCDEVEAELKKIEDEIGFKFELFFSQGRLIRESMANLRNTGLWGALFAAIVLFFFLRAVRMTALITLAIPLCVMISVTLLYFIDWSLNLLTMMGLMVAIGMVVDNAIVVVENIYRRRVTGEDSHDASIRGASEVALAITTATLTTVVVFLPLMVMSGNADLSFFLSRVGLPVIVALVGSLFVALLLIPVAAKRVAETRIKRDPRIIDRPRGVYLIGLSWVLRHRRDAVLIALALSASMLYPMEKVKRSDSMRGVDNSIHLSLRPPRFLEWDELSEVASEVEAFLDSRRDVYGIRNIRFAYWPGSKGKLRFWILLEEEGSVPWWHQAYRGFRKWTGYPLDDRIDRKAVVEDIREHMPTFVGHRVHLDGGGIGTPNLAIELAGDDRDLLAKLRAEVARRLTEIPSVTGIFTENDSGSDEVRIEIDRESAQAYEISPYRVARSLSYQFGGVALPGYVSRDKEMDIRLHLNKLDRRSVQQLKDLGFQSKSGEEIPLSAFASLQITGGLKTVLRRDGKLVLSCQVFAKEEDLDSLYGEIDRAMEGFKMPPGYSWDKGDRYDKFRESEEAMQFAVLLAITFVFLLMGVLFESLILPFSVLFCIPFAFLGVYWTLFLTETVMDRMAQVGIIVLIGVVVNNAIVLVDMVNRLRAEGKDRMEAILEAGTNRFRPILMTTFTTVFGLVPMSLTSNTLMGVPYSSMGRAMAGGLLCATFLTLFVVPLFYTCLDDLRTALRGILFSAFSRTGTVSFRRPEPAD